MMTANKVTLIFGPMVKPPLIPGYPVPTDPWKPPTKEYVVGQEGVRSITIENGEVRIGFGETVTAWSGIPYTAEYSI